MKFLRRAWWFGISEEDNIKQKSFEIIILEYVFSRNKYVMPLVHNIIVIWSSSFRYLHLDNYFLLKIFRMHWAWPGHCRCPRKYRKSVHIGDDFTTTLSTNPVLETLFNNFLVVKKTKNGKKQITKEIVAAKDTTARSNCAGVGLRAAWVLRVE